MENKKNEHKQERDDRGYFMEEKKEKQHHYNHPSIDSIRKSLFGKKTLVIRKTNLKKLKNMNDKRNSGSSPIKLVTSPYDSNVKTCCSTSTSSTGNNNNNRTSSRNSRTSSGTYNRTTNNNRTSSSKSSRSSPGCTVSPLMKQHVMDQKGKYIEWMSLFQLSFI